MHPLKFFGSLLNLNMFFTGNIRKYTYSLVTLLAIAGLTAKTSVAQENREIAPGEASSLNASLDQKVTAANFRVLPATLNLIKQHEGFRPYAYIDTSGLPVIGYGQTRINGRTVRMGEYITQAQADTALEQEIYHIQRQVLDSVSVDLNPHQLGALTSLVYNAGTRVITQSTLSRKLNAGDFVGAANEFTRWNKANQGGVLVPFPGLTKRRQEEQKLFLTPVY